MSGQVPPQAEPRHFAYLDAVRGYAFLGVICTHVANMVGPFPGHWLLGQGAYGVQLFFLASAITLCQSMQVRQKAETAPVLFFYLRRLFRIAPMFWMAMAFYWLFPLVMPKVWLSYYSPDGVRPAYFFLTALFLHGWHPYTFNSIVPGGWSIAVEMTFYLFFPIAFYYLNSLKKTALAAVLGIIFIDGLLAKWGYAWVRQQFFPEVLDRVWEFFRSLWFPSQITVFLTGMLVYRLIGTDRIKILAKNRFQAGWLLGLCFSILILLNWLHKVYGSLVYPSDYVVLALAGCIVAVSGGVSVLWVNPLIGRLGKISYSCYLVHFAAMGLAMRLLGLSFRPTSAFFDAGNPFGNLVLLTTILAVGLIITVAVSTLTYHLIEKPGIALGRKLIERLSARAV